MCIINPENKIVRLIGGWTIGFLGPIGFGVSLGLTAIEMAGGFDFIYDSFDNTQINRVGFD